MKLFNGRAATEEYMSTHSLTFSTPEMTLKKFALWLGEQVTSPDSQETVPRLTLFLQEKSDSSSQITEPVIDDTFRPSGAVTEMYGREIAGVGEEKQQPNVSQVEVGKNCINCGTDLNINSKFCKACGSKQV
jgi:hypothetical protein